MVKVLVLGATGYLGNNVALTLRRAGHKVWGLVRSPAKASSLAKLEVIPVIGSLQDDSIPKAVEGFNIDVVVDASGANQEGKQTIEMVIKLATARLERHKSNGKVAKLGFIYVSGMWIHGSSFAPINDLDPVGTSVSPNQPPAMLAWRPALEQSILAARAVLNGVIIRPALMYGHSQSAWGMYFGPLLEAKGKGESKVALAGKSDSLGGLVHVEDVAAGVTGAVANIEQLGSDSVFPVFDLTASYESMPTILTHAAKAIGFTGAIEYSGVEGNYFADAMNTNVNGDSGRAKRLLGWDPKRTSMLAEINVHVAAFVASVSK